MTRSPRARGIRIASAWVGTALTAQLGLGRGCRQALVKEMDAWDDELGFTERMLAQDVRNNSAWNHRMLAVRHEMDALGSAGQALMDREVAFTESQARSPLEGTTWAGCYD